MSVAEKKMPKDKSYGAADIEVLEGLEPVRKRPGMFIAGTDTPAGLHQLVFEILDNSVDEAMNGHASRIDITLHTDGQSVTISDNGRGIPVEKHPKFKKPALELILTTLHAGGKFSDKNYQTAGGLHGVGSSVVNALSSELVATVTRDGKEHQQSFARGKAKGPLKTTKENVRGTGTAIFFRPDPTIFPKIDFSKEIICDTLQTKAYLNPGLRLVFLDEKSGEKREYFYTDGLIAYTSIWERGYRRIGLIISKVSRTRFSAGYLLGQMRMNARPVIKPLVLSLERNDATLNKLAAWLKHEKPDALLTDEPYLNDMLKRLGVRVPEDVGLAAMSVLDGNADAGIYQNSEEIGKVAIQLLISLLHHNETGIPKICREVLIEGHWVDGSTLPIITPADAR